MAAVTHKTIDVNGINVFYREAGTPDLPGLLLLHGHASSSHTFRNLLPLLSTHFHAVAPDYPGFGHSDRPSPKDYTYTFTTLATTLNNFTNQIGLTKYYIYLFDFGAPIGFMLAVQNPNRIQGFFSQSGNAYDSGLSPAFEMIRAFWANPDDQSKVDAAKHIFTPEGLRGAYTHGVPDPSLVGPDAAALDIYFTSRPGAVDIQLALLRDYENNVKTYPSWQKWLREHQPKIIAVWGKNDPFFAAPGAEAFKQDVPDADVELIDAGHFVLETNAADVVQGLKKLLL